MTLAQRLFLLVVVALLPALAIQANPLPVARSTAAKASSAERPALTYGRRSGTLGT